MNSQIAITLLKDLEQSLDDYCELNDEGKTAFSMAITALELFGISEQLPSVHPELSNNSPELDNKNGESISRQAAIDAVKEYFKFSPLEGRQCAKAIERVPSAQPEQKWIPVTESTLPEKGMVVIAKGERGTWDFGTYRGHGDDIHFWHWKKNTFKRVYWWMYKDNALPEPYREDEEN